MKSITKYNSWFFSVVPIGFLIFSFSRRELRGPYWLGINADPEYAYLLNFLNIINFDTPGHTDHPGTPFQVFGAVITKIVFLVRQNLGITVKSEITEDVLHHPELYLSAVNTILLILISISIFFTGFIAYRLRKSICLSLILQSSIFLVTTISTSYRVSPEPFLLLISQLLVIVLILFLYSPSFENSKTFLISLSLLIGLGIAAKVTFFPVSLILLIILPNLLRLILAVTISIISFVVATIPIWSKYPRVFKWLLSIAIHTDRYGHGDPTFMNLQKSLENYYILYNQDKLYFSLIGIFVFVQFACSLLFCFRYLMKSKVFNDEVSKDTLKLYFLSLILVCVHCTQIFITIKHPGIHYLLPSMGFIGLTLFTQLDLIINLTKNLAPHLRESRLLFSKILLVSLTTFLIIILMKNFQLYSDKTYSQYKTYKDEILRLEQLLSNEYSDCIQVSYYRSSSLPYAFKFGDSHAGRNFAEQLSLIYPEHYFYNIWNKKYATFEKSNITLEEESENKCFVLRGSPFSEEGYQQYMPNSELEEIFSGQYESAYTALKLSGVR